MPTAGAPETSAMARIGAAMVALITGPGRSPAPRRRRSARRRGGCSGGRGAGVVFAEEGLFSHRAPMALGRTPPGEHRQVADELETMARPCPGQASRDRGRAASRGSASAPAHHDEDVDRRGDRDPGQALPTARRTCRPRVGIHRSAARWARRSKTRLRAIAATLLAVPGEQARPQRLMGAPGARRQHDHGRPAGCRRWPMPRGSG